MEVEFPWKWSQLKWSEKVMEKCFTKKGVRESFLFTSRSGDNEFGKFCPYSEMCRQTCFKWVARKVPIKGMS